MAEGRTNAKYADHREIYFSKPGMWATGKEIRETLEDKEAINAVVFFRRYDEMGLPYGPWGMNPNLCVEVVEALAPLRDTYKPRLM